MYPTAKINVIIYYIELPMSCLSNAYLTLYNCKESPMHIFKKLTVIDLISPLNLNF